MTRIFLVPPAVIASDRVLEKKGRVNCYKLSGSKVKVDYEQAAEGVHSD